tara:strand:+ start:1705 stop:2766 length:1062 start_codon:yes stop_codon:yes gene_type:complete
MDNRLAQSRNFLELNGLNTIRQDAKTGNADQKKAALQEAAQQFEAIFMQMLLKSMRKAQDVLASDSPFNSETSKSYREMHDQQMAMELSTSGSLGLSELIVRQLGGDDNFTPSSLLRNDSGITSEKAVSKSYQLGKPTDFNPLVVANQLSGAQGQASSSHQQASTKPLGLSETSVPNNQQSVGINIALTGQLNEQAFSQPKDFVTALTGPAKMVEQQLGVPFEVVIAQAALETGWGQKIIKSEQGQSSHNLFNIKADSRWPGEKITKETLEFEQGTLVKKSAPFRRYDNLKESVKDYINFLSTSERYQPALEKAGDVEHFLHGIQKAGYATDPNYATKIMATLRTVSGLLNNP